MKRFLGILLLALSIGSLGSLLNISYAKAASPWDNLLKTTDTLNVRYQIPSGFNSCYEDVEVTATYNDIVFDVDNWNQDTRHLYDEYTESLSFAISNGSYYIFERRSTNNTKTLEIVWSNSGIGLDWRYFNGDYSVTAVDLLQNNLKAIRINAFQSGNCEPQVYQAVTMSNWGEELASSAYNINIYLFDHSSNFEYNYPEGYEGALMPINRPGVDNVPDWYVPSAVDWKVSISDMNFFTTDMKYPFLCEGDLAPSIITEIINEDNVVVDEQTFGAPSQIWFQAEKLDIEQKFTVRGQYFCGDDDALQFTHWGSLEFTIGENGHLKENMFSNCMVLEAFTNPEFDYMACLNNIYIFANMLSFDTVRFANSWVSQGNCTTLGTLGNWLNLSNKTVCPYFSNEVRAVITPFITFLLGLLTVKFIAGKGSHGSMRESI